MGIEKVLVIKFRLTLLISVGGTSADARLKSKYRCSVF